MNDSDPKKPSWWTTLPGVLTAAAALVTALTGFYAAVLRGSNEPQRDDPCKLPFEHRPMTCLEEKK